MKRASVMIVSLAGVLAALTQAGCVSLDEHNKLKAAYYECDGTRQQLMSKVALYEERIRAMTEEVERLRASGPAVERALRDRITELEADIARLREAAAGANQQINVTFGGPLPTAIDKALKDFADKYGLIYNAERGSVQFSSDLIFDLGSWNLKADVARQLADFANIINMPEAREFDVLVVGHTDGVPISRPETRAITPSNWHLSVYRSVSVVQALQKDGVAPARLAAMGFGQERPRPGTSNAAARPPGTKENRRVEVFIVPRKTLAGASAAAPIVITGQEIAAMND